MLNEQARKWVETLRSGQYKQATDYLRTKDNTFCCLGVACDLINPHGWDYTNPQCPEMHQLSVLLPQSIQEALDLQTSDGRFIATVQWLQRLHREYSGLFDEEQINHFIKEAKARDIMGHENIKTLTEMNDVQAMNFEQIAAIIESQPPLLFGFISAEELETDDTEGTPNA